MLPLPVLVERPAGRPPELLAAPRADRVLLGHAGLVVGRQLLHGELDLALGALEGGLLEVLLLVLVVDELLGKVGDEVALRALEPAPEVLQGGNSVEKIITLRVAIFQNVIPSFPWIAPGWRAGGAIQR